MRYFVTNKDLIPLKAQPSEGYTKLEAINRAQREATEDKRLFGFTWKEATSGYHIVDSNFHYCSELDNAI